jgi:hypothetical protein
VPVTQTQQFDAALSRVIMSWTIGTMRMPALKQREALIELLSRGMGRPGLEGLVILLKEIVVATRFLQLFPIWWEMSVFKYMANANKALNLTNKA